MTFRFIDISGQSFGALSVISFAGTVKEQGREREHHYPIFQCVCLCGQIVFRKKKQLTNRHALSCGAIDCKRKAWRVAR